MGHYDILIKNGNLFDIGNGLDVAISGGKIAAIGKDLSATADTVIDATDKLVAPSFVDSHTHLDKVLSAIDLDADGLAEAVAQAAEFQASVSKEDSCENIKARARVILDWEAANGSCAIKSHVRLDDAWGAEGLRAMLELKEEYRGIIDVLNITPYDPSCDKEWREAAEKGEIDFIAGYPGLYGSDAFAEEADPMFELAAQYNLPLDLHINEFDGPDARLFEYVLNKSMEMGLGERLTCGHVTSLAAVSDEEAARLIALAKKADVNIITLPSCNMYLGGRNDKQPIRRGVTRIHEFLQAGVNIAYASDNIRDHFRPFGNGDMLEEALFTAQCIQYGTTKQLETVFRMGTYNAAKNCLLKDYGLAEGCRADLTVFNEHSAAQAVISQKVRPYVIKDGKVIARDGKLV